MIVYIHLHLLFIQKNKPHSAPVAHMPVTLKYYKRRSRHYIRIGVVCALTIESYSGRNAKPIASNTRIFSYISIVNYRECSVQQRHATRFSLPIMQTLSQRHKK